MQTFAKIFPKICFFLEVFCYIKKEKCESLQKSSLTNGAEGIRVLCLKELLIWKNWFIPWVMDT